MTSPASAHVAVIDVGSNSVRLVVYDQACRAPIPRFNEKALCALGRGLTDGGTLDPAAAAAAHRAIVRYVRLAAAMEVGDLRIANLYVVNGQAVGSEKYAYKLNWLERVTEHLAVEAARHPNLIVLGDFNIAPEDRDVHDPVAWKDQILCSEPEREALRRLLGIGLADSFREFHQNDGAFSWWDYRQAAFRRNLGLRIDLVLASHNLRPRLAGASIDLEPRRWDRPSDHAPALLELNA